MGTSEKYKIFKASVLVKSLLVRFMNPKLDDDFCIIFKRCSLREKVESKVTPESQMSNTR